MKDIIQVTRSSMPPFEEYCAEIKSLWDSRWLTNMGVKHQQFQAELTGYLGAEQVELVVNGHMAIELALQALALQGEVITTPFTFASTTQAIVRNGLAPVFCDIDPETFTIDSAKIEALITERTSAIVPVHVYGNICDVEAIQRIAKKYDLKVLYDAAHGFGVRYRGYGIGAYGDASCFSFHATKVFHSIEGGAICFQGEALGKRIRALRNFGISTSDGVEEVGLNAKMNEFCAAMGMCNLRNFYQDVERRGHAAQRYRERLGGVSGLQLSPVQSQVQPNYAYFPVVFDETAFGADRNTVLRVLAMHNIGARKYFYPLTSTFDCYGGRFSSNGTPIAHQVSQRILCLPLYAELDLNTVDRICDIVLGCRA